MRRKPRLLRNLAAALGIAFSPAFAEASAVWRAQDVSILAPLPQNEEEFEQALKISDLGPGGGLIPLAVIAQLPKLLDAADRDQTYQHDLRVIAVRFDPCFFEGDGEPSDASCRRQVRMVWQPLEKVGNHYEAKDAALHSFYEFTPSAWANLLTEYQNLLAPRSALSPTLGLHPQLLREGRTGPFGTALRNLLLRHCGASNLTRVTMVSLDFGRNQWVFRGYDVGPNLALERIHVTGTGATGQVLNVAERGSWELNYAIAPLLPSGPRLRLFENSSAVKNELGQAEMKGIARELLQIEDPRRKNPGNVDCVSCHTAAPMLSWMARNFLSWDWRQDFASDTFPGPVAPEPRPALTSDQIRSFGFFEQTPIVSQRVINETLSVLTRMNQ